jgi:hypothetical protein
MSGPDEQMYRVAEVIDTYLWNHSVRWHSRSADHIWLDANAKCGIALALKEAGLLAEPKPDRSQDVRFLEWGDSRLGPMNSRGEQKCY